MTKLSLVIFSQLSDIQIGYLNHDNLITNINFIKFLMMKYRNLDTKIDPVKEWKEFEEKILH